MSQQVAAHRGPRLSSPDSGQRIRSCYCVDHLVVYLTNYSSEKNTVNKNANECYNDRDDVHNYVLVIEQSS